MDRISLSGVTATGYHGVFDFERREGQPFVVDAVLHLDFGRAAASDDVRDTAHYGEVAGRITDWITGEPLNLIEALAVTDGRRPAQGIQHRSRGDHCAQAKGPHRGSLRRRGRQRLPGAHMNSHNAGTRGRCWPWAATWASATTRCPKPSADLVGPAGSAAPRGLAGGADQGRGRPGRPAGLPQHGDFGGDRRSNRWSSSGTARRWKTSTTGSARCAGGRGRSTSTSSSTVTWKAPIPS